MTVVPKYNFLPGTEVTLLSRPMAFTGFEEHGYSMVGLEDGAITVVPFKRLIEQLKLPGAKINSAQAATGDRLKMRLGGFTSIHALKNKRQRAVGRFHVAMCKAVDIYVSFRQTNDPKFRPSIRQLATDEARTFIAAEAQLLLGKQVYLTPSKTADTVKGHHLYEGRTIWEYYNVYKELRPDESSAEALVPLRHLSGNRVPRIPFILRNLMTEASEEIGLDKKCTSVANVYSYLETLIKEENDKRKLNGLPILIVPSAATLRKHRDALVTPTEYAIGVLGARETKRKKGRGSTDVRALMIGELCGMDEQKMSMVTSAKAAGLWDTLADETKDAFENADEYIRKRLHLIVMFDVASRMPLAWIITENPNAEATLALIRMATRDKNREKIRYGCKNAAASACGISLLRNDNGIGLRNQTVISALMGLGTLNQITRTYSPTDRAHDERFFGTLESRFFKLMPGYTGRRPGDVPGYDAIKYGAAVVEFAYGMVSRYLIDEYPFERHYGTEIFGRRPWDVYQQINQTRGQIEPADPHTRRIHLGWEVNSTPSDEGVRVFEGIWFNSDELQIAREKHFFKGKATVFVDPDDLSIATVVLPGVQDPIEVTIQTTVFADMTLGEVLQLIAECRHEDPRVTELYYERLIDVRNRRFSDISTIGVEHDLPRSYSTIEECKALAKAVFAGARIVGTKRLAGTTAPVDITSLKRSEGVFLIGGGATVIDGAVNQVVATSEKDEVGLGQSDVPNQAKPQKAPTNKPRPSKKPEPTPTQGLSMKFARPRNLKELE